MNKKAILKLSLAVILFITFISCSKDDDKPNPDKVNYPTELTFKKEGEVKAEYWKGGKLVNMSESELDSYIETNKGCFKNFTDETESICKKTKIVFKDENKLIFTYNEGKFNLGYEFSNDTLKVMAEGKKLALGVGNREELKIYGNLTMYKIYEESLPKGTCGGDEYFKHNFDGQFFLNTHEYHSLPISKPEEMGEKDEVFFYNKEYILGQ